MFEKLKKYKAIILAGLLIVLSPVIVYIIVFHDMKWGKPSDFAAFANYFSNILMPFLTLGTIIALLITLKYQQNMFEKQSKSETFRSYVMRFDLAINAYENEIRNEYFLFECSSGTLKVSYQEIESLPDTDPRYNNIHDFLDSLPIYQMKIKIKGNVDEEIKRNCYLVEKIKLRAFEIFHLYKSCYEYHSKEDYGIIYTLSNKSKLILHKLKNMKILTNVNEIESLSEILKTSSK